MRAERGDGALRGEMLGEIYLCHVKLSSASWSKRSEKVTFEQRRRGTARNGGDKVATRIATIDRTGSYEPCSWSLSL